MCDNITGKRLSQVAVQRARREEREFMCKRAVQRKGKFQLSSVSWEDETRHPLERSALTSNKGGGDLVVIGSRLVATGRWTSRKTMWSAQHHRWKPCDSLHEPCHGHADDECLWSCLQKDGVVCCPGAGKSNPCFGKFNPCLCTHASNGIRLFTTGRRSS